MQCKRSMEFGLIVNTRLVRIATNAATCAANTETVPWIHLGSKLCLPPTTRRMTASTRNNAQEEATITGPSHSTRSMSAARNEENLDG